MLPNASKEPGKPTKSTAKCRQLSPKEKERLFNKYVMPNLKDIKSCFAKWSTISVRITRNKS